MFSCHNIYRKSTSTVLLVTCLSESYYCAYVVKSYLTHFKSSLNSLQEISRQKFSVLLKDIWDLSVEKTMPAAEFVAVVYVDETRHFPLGLYLLFCLHVKLVIRGAFYTYYKGMRTQIHKSTFTKLTTPFHLTSTFRAHHPP